MCGLAALVDIPAALPFPCTGSTPTTAASSSTTTCCELCRRNEITFTRSRPGNKNDRAHAEQKNWTVVRRAVGYWRYDTGKELDVLNLIWAAQALLTNLFLPQQKLTGKTRIGARVIKTYDAPRTPARRLLDDHPDLVDDHDRRHIEHQLATLNPAQIRRDIGVLQDHLKMFAIRRGPVQPATRRHAAYTSKTKIRPPAKRAI